MARHEPNIRASVRTEVDIDELLSLLRDATDATESERREAIACYLSGSEGWNDALQRLGGAFADATGLKGRKAD
ncbi:MAG TPA: hypothetical protein VN106_03830 [Sphingomicrobium sp.]|nr:hypothetical protein [Sphingomicrobium sp.]